MNIREVQVDDLETVKVMIEELEELKFDPLVFGKYFNSNFIGVTKVIRNFVCTVLPLDSKSTFPHLIIITL